MKTFKAAKWDSDASGDNTYQELFKGTKRKKKSKIKFHVGEIVQDRDKKKRLKKILKKLKDIESNGLLKVQSDAKIVPKNDKIVAQEKNNSKLITSSRKKTKNSIVVKRPQEKKIKQSRSEKESDVEENEVTRKQKRILNKYSSELNTLNEHSDRLHKELSREKKKQEELMRKFKDIGGKQIHLSRIIESKAKDKFGEDTSSKKSKILHEAKRNDLNKMTVIPNNEMRKKKKMHEKLRNVLNENKLELYKKPVLSLRQRMMEKLKAARFRFLNEQIYTTSSKEAQKIFKSDPDAFTAYHEGYQQQVRSWPLNPVDVIIKGIKKMPKNYVVADFGCGDAKLARTVDQKVHSFDLVAVNDGVVACDMSRVPLDDASVNVAVFCLSLMGTNLHDYLLEANRVLKEGGLLKIAEVESRFENVDNFIEGVQHFGFKKTWKDLSQDLFYFIDFKKQRSVKNRKKLPTISLLPCLYKKR